MDRGSFSRGGLPRIPRSASTALVVVAALLAAGFAGWLLWDASNRHGSGRPVAAAPVADSPAPGPRASLAPQPAHPTDPPPPAETRAGAPASSPAPAASSTDTGKGPAAGERLRGKVVVLDPGHNIHNQEHPAEIDRQVDVGNGRKECDTTGTSTNAGYAEAAFSLDVAHRARALLEGMGATVTLTHDGERPYGPCVDERAEIGNRAHADAAVSVHADGAAAGDRGFHVILPAPVRAGKADTASIVGPSRELGTRLVSGFAAATGTSPSNYIGAGTGLDVRGDLGGLNLSAVPKVFLECGNMRDARDAALLTDPAWRQKAAQGIADGIAAFLLD
ncbi:N-acetylmuramoyl-L-alanine amidase [Streptomyces gamaensis]|uniref:N-acetylmuramoyl-L-alanine amidase n=1 Tax=Streptomyces gamaensis TaxID=1763542 RepID=A0ABW0Z0U3_9ACTN